MMVEKGLSLIVFKDIKLHELSVIRKSVQAQALAMGADSTAVDDIVVVVNEAAANIIRHGYHGRPGNIEIALYQDREALVVKIRDEAIPFNPLTKEHPDITLALDQRQLGGMGVLMMRHFADQISYQLTAEGRNELTIRKNRSFKSFQKEEK